ncbi:hypothetical protein [Pontibacter beigongshangensis]|uniref:hypothetical protein n=1 Tax=Pontibacter beigongshangensis TaxID=2574733 RepID=UPI00164EE3CE|nr:hypothetical protein [Pontibacter beigongshangensis]
MKLNEIPKKNIYKAPDGYFDRLPRQIMERTASRGTSAASSGFSIWKPVRLAFAPLVLLLVFVGVYFLNVKEQPQQSDFQSYASRLGETEILTYLSASHVHLEPSDFEELNLTEQEITSDFMNISPEVAEEELEYYQLSNLTY